MKSTLYRLFSFGLLLIIEFVPSACRRVLEFDIPKPQSNNTVVVRSNVFVLDSLYKDQLIELKDDYLLFIDP